MTTPSRISPPPVLLAGAAGLSAVVVALLGVAYDRSPVDEIDKRVASWVARELPAWVEALARPLSWAGGWLGITVVGAATVVALLRRHEPIDAAFLAATFAGGQLIANGLKLVYDRPRPTYGSAVDLPQSAAFPSGHAAAATACVGALAVLAVERLEGPRQRATVWVCAAALAAGIGLSRIALGVHWLSDVVAGWAVGLGWLFLCLLGREALRAREGGYP